MVFPALAILLDRATLNALGRHNGLSSIMPADGGDCEDVIAQCTKCGIDIEDLAAWLQEEGAKSFVNSWNDLMAVIASKSAALKKAS